MVLCVTCCVLEQVCGSAVHAAGAHLLATSCVASVHVLFQCMCCSFTFWGGGLVLVFVPLVCCMFVGVFALSILFCLQAGAMPAGAFSAVPYSCCALLCILILLPFAAVLLALRRLQCRCDTGVCAGHAARNVYVS
jgi:hypothetical protein